MDRIIEIKVNGNYLTKDNKNAGVRGEANATKLRITFDEGWQDYAKKVTFWDAYGNNPTEIRLGIIDLEGNWITNGTTYLVPIPREAMAEAGMLTFVIDGYYGSKDEMGNVYDSVIQRSLSDKLEVKDAPIAEGATEPEIIETDEATRLQQQIDKMLGDVQKIAGQAEESKEKAGNSAMEAIEYSNFAMKYSQGAMESAKNANDSADAASLFSSMAEASKERTETAMAQAIEAIKKQPRIGDNGNWFVWDASTEEWKDTGVRAQSGSTVYVGDNPPDDADVWIYPDGIAVIYATAEDVKAVRQLLYDVANKVASTLTTVTVYANKWTPSPTHKDRWYQVVTITDVTITDKSKVNVYPDGDMLDELYERLVSVYAEQENGVVKVYCKGRPLLNTYTMQVSVKEVEVNEQ